MRAGRKDARWRMPKFRLDRQELTDYRKTLIPPSSNRALSACAEFRGDVLIVESEHDSLVPHAVIQNYMSACAQARSLTYRLIAGADHALSDEASRLSYASHLVKWMTEMVLGARVGPDVT